MHDPLKHMEIRRGLPNNAFGMVRNNGTRPHQGWDLWAPVGTQIFAVADGVVQFVRTNSGAYGTQICISFQDPRNTEQSAELFAFYAHLSQLYVAAGNSVVEGQVIGLTGKSGNASGFTSIEDEHLHFEVRTQVSPGRGLGGRIDPAIIFGYELLTSRNDPAAPECSLDEEVDICPA